MTKQGGAIKTWKRRWFVLKGNKLWYFKTKTDTVAKGFIELEATTLIRDESATSKKKKPMFSIQARGVKGRRVFMIIPDTQQESLEWIQAIRLNIKACASGGFEKPAQDAGSAYSGSTGGLSFPSYLIIIIIIIIIFLLFILFLHHCFFFLFPLFSASDVQAQPVPTMTSPMSAGVAAVPAMSAGPVLDPNSVRGRVFNARQAVPFLREEESKVLEFWQIWSDSIPPKEELAAGQSMEYTIATSADMDKLTWRVSGPQSIFIQKMVDFFWNVGAPETEIDRLNDVGALINPLKIGSWIDMSGKCGMDGGWFFPVDIDIKAAIEAADAGEPTHTVMQWAEKHNVARCFSVGRDMGAAPPRQTELRVVLPGADAGSQLAVAQDAFATFGFPAIPEAALGLLYTYTPSEPYCLSVVTSSDGFVRIGLLVPKPPRDLVVQMADVAGGRRDAVETFANTVGCACPQFAEYQFLMKGFGYGVYKEGFDITFHWNIGEEFA